MNTHVLPVVGTKEFCRISNFYTNKCLFYFILYKKIHSSFASKCRIPRKSDQKRKPFSAFSFFLHKLFGNFLNLWKSALFANGGSCFCELRTRIENELKTDWERLENMSLVGNSSWAKPFGTLAFLILSQPTCPNNSPTFTASFKTPEVLGQKINFAPKIILQRIAADDEPKMFTLLPFCNIEHSTLDTCLDGHRNNSRIFDERCWSNLASDRIEDYARSKTLAEKAAWDYWSSLDSKFNCYFCSIAFFHMQNAMSHLREPNFEMYILFELFICAQVTTWS